MDSFWSHLAIAIVAGLIGAGGGGGFILTFIKQRHANMLAERRELLGQRDRLIDRQDLQIAQMLVRERMCVEDQVRLRADGRWLCDVLCRYHQQLLDAGIVKEPCPHFAAHFAEPNAKAQEARFAAIQAEHSVSLLHEEAESLRSHRSRDSNLPEVRNDIDMRG